MTDVENEVPQVRTTVYAPKVDMLKLKAKLALKGLGISNWFRRKVKEEINKD